MGRILRWSWYTVGNVKLAWLRSFKFVAIYVCGRTCWQPVTSQNMYSINCKYSCYAATFPFTANLNLHSRQPQQNQGQYPKWMKGIHWTTEVDNTREYPKTLHHLHFVKRYEFSIQNIIEWNSQMKIKRIWNERKNKFVLNLVSIESLKMNKPNYTFFCVFLASRPCVPALVFQFLPAYTDTWMK